MKITSKKIVEQAFLRGQTYYSPLFKAKYFQTGNPFISIVVSKKQLPHAVDRNRAKRRISSILQNQKSYSGTLVIIAHKNVLTIPFSTLQNELDLLFQQLEP